MTRPLLLGIDDGTTAVKAVLHDLDLRPVAQARRPVAARHPRPGWVEQDPAEVLGAVVDAVAEVLAAAPAGTEVAACGLDHQGESVLAWDAGSGAPLSPIVVWQCKRSQPILERLRAAGREPDIRAISGLPLDPYFSAGKLAWLLEEVPAVQAAADAGTLRLGTVDAFLSDRLGGGFATDPSTASRTQLCGSGAGAWDERLCAHFGVPPSALPAIADTAGPLGELRHPAWPTPLPLTARVCDQQAALAGSACVTPGSAKATYGTGVFVLSHAGPTAPDAGTTLLPTVAWRIGGRVEHALDGGVFTAGALLEWLAGGLGLAASAAEVAALATTVPDAGGVRVLPALAGLGAPWWDPDARGVVAGLTAAVGPAQIARAALEGIAWRVADVVAAVAAAAGPAPGALRADGGLTASDTLLALQADAAGTSVGIGATADATAAGAAGLAAIGAGLIPTTADLADRLPAVRLVHPAHDADWRATEHAAWQAFVRGAAALGR